MSKAINLETLRNEEKALGLTDKYNVITTSKIVEKFEDRGFVITDYSEARARSEDKINKQKHFVRMALKSDMDLLERPEVVIHNSYDGSTRLKMLIGMFRFVCSNGLVIGDNLSEPVKIKHSNNKWDYFVWKAIEEYSMKIEKQKAVVEAMKNYYMSYSDEVRFAEKAVQLREDIVNVLDPRELVTVKRREDVGKNLWLTFNKVQESIVCGYFTKIFRPEDEDFYLAKAQVLTDVNKIIDINHRLGKMAEEMVA